MVIQYKDASRVEYFEYDNLWDGTYDTDKWGVAASGGGNTFDAGGLKTYSSMSGESSATASAYTKIDLRSFGYRYVTFTGSATSVAQGTGTGDHAQSTVRIRLTSTDTGTDQNTLCSAYCQYLGEGAAGDGGVGAYSKAIFVIDLNYSSTEIKVYRNGNKGDSSIGGTTAAATTVLLADETIIDISTWTIVGIEITASSSVTDSAGDTDSNCTGILGPIRFSNVLPGSMGRLYTTS